jgi:iron complex outermembrane receptor protein
MLRHSIPLLAAACLLPGICSAQSEAADSSLVNGAPTPLSPVEVRAIRASSDAPFAKTEISGAALQKANLGQDLPFLLQYTPSAVVTSDAGAGVGYTGLRIRGTDGTRINTTLNGIAVNDGESSGTFFVDLPDLASSVNSIQIQRGVGSSTNGAGAFGGTLSISTLGLSDKAGASAAVSYGSFNTQKYTLSAGTGMLPGRVAFGLRLSRITSDGFVDRGASALASIQVQGLWQPTEKTSIKAMILQGREETYQSWNGVPEEKLRGTDSALAAHYANNVGGTYFPPKDSVNLFGSDPRRYNYFTYENQVDNYRQNYYQLFADHEFSSAVTAHAGLFLTRGIGYYEEYKPDEALGAYGLPSFTTPAGDTFDNTALIRRIWLDNYNYGTVFSVLWDAGAKTKITLGGGWSQYAGRHYGNVIWAGYGAPDHHRWYNLDAQKNDLNLYAKAEHRASSRLLLYADLQGRSIGYFMNGFRNNPDLRPAVSYTFFNPKAGATYFLQSSSAQRQKLYVSAAMAHKEPNRDDFEAGVDNLPKPEQLVDVEGGYELSSGGLHVGANLYYMYYRDQLVLTGRINDVGAFTRTNVPASFRRGLELQGGWKPVAWMSVDANATFSQNKIDNFTEYIFNYDDASQLAVSHGTTDIAFSPSIIAGGGLAFTPFTHSARGKALGIELLGKYVSRQYLDNTSNDARSLDPYGLCDVRLRYNLAVRPFRELGFTLLLNNVLDHEYESNGYTYSYIAGGATTTQNYYFPQAGFNWLLGINMKW